MLLLLGFALLALLIARIGPERLWLAWRQAAKPPIVAAALVFAGGIFVRALKWRIFLRATEHRVPYFACLRAYVLNAFLGNLTPARGGEMLAPIWLAEYRVPAATSLAIVVVDRLLDVVAILSLFCLAAWNLGRLVPAASAAYRHAGFAAAAIVTGALLALLIVLARLPWAVARLEKRPGRISARLTALLRSFQQALTPLRRRGVLAPNLCLTFASWMFDIATGYLVIRAFLPELGYLDSATATLFACVASIASFIPGGIGVGAIGYTMVITLLGYDEKAVASGAVVVTLLTQLTRAALAGLLYRRRGAARPD